MNKPAISDKTEMYHLLVTGRLGNTIPQFYSVAEWQASPDYHKYAIWGARTLVPQGPTFFNCTPAQLVERLSEPEFVGYPVMISPYLDVLVSLTLWANVWDAPTGLIVHGIEYPPVGFTWRQVMSDPSKTKHWEGVAAKMLLRKHMDPNSYDDMTALFEKWPGHILEFSACDRCIGTLPHRNCVVWEMRAY